MDSDQLEVLHDHHKDSFFYIRERERQRDRLFLLQIGLTLFLGVAVLFTANISEILQSVKFAGAQADLGKLPIPSLITGVWTFIFALTLRYCQVSILIERQYSYLHKLEARISAELGHSDLYVRESSSYLDEYPLFSNWTWIAYVYIFPAFAVLVTVSLVVAEWFSVNSGWPFKVVDSTLALCICMTLILYRLLPLGARRRKLETAASTADDRGTIPTPGAP